MSKPSREPDYISSMGTYLWFKELVYLDVMTGKLISISFNYEISKLQVAETKWSFSQEIQDAYRDWDHKAFEKTLGLGSEDGNDR